MSVYSGKTKQELRRTLFKEREKLRLFRFAMAGGKTKNVREGAVIRKEIARLLTEINAQVL